jgi:hypothetical protein
MTMLDAYSFSLGLGLGLFLAGIFEWGKIVRSKEIKRIHEAGADLDRYFAAEDEPKKVSWFPRDGRSRVMARCATTDCGRLACPVCRWGRLKPIGQSVSTTDPMREDAKPDLNTKKQRSAIMPVKRHRAGPWRGTW